MRRWLTAAVVAQMLVVPVQASAECAWVLWERSDQYHRPKERPISWNVGWQMKSAHESRLECLDASSQEARRLARWYTTNLKGAKVDHAGSSVSMESHFEHGSMQSLVQYSCLPDTIDPRGPKGGGR